MSRTLPKTIKNDIFFEHVQEYIDAGKEVVFSVRGSSMSPFLEEQDLITVKPLVNITLKIGHIVLAYFKNGYILHRIIHLDKHYVVLAGDANLAQIEKIDRKDIIGFLSEATRNDKQIPLYTRKVLYLAKVWYHIRPLRRVWAKLFKRKINP